MNYQHSFYDYESARRATTAPMMRPTSLLLLDPCSSFCTNRHASDRNEHYHALYLSPQNDEAPPHQEEKSTSSSNFGSLPFQSDRWTVVVAMVVLLTSFVLGIGLGIHFCGEFGTGNDAVVDVYLVNHSAMYFDKNYNNTRHISPTRTMSMTPRADADTDPGRDSCQEQTIHPDTTKHQSDFSPPSRQRQGTHYYHHQPHVGFWGPQKAAPSSTKDMDDGDATIVPAPSPAQFISLIPPPPPTAIHHPISWTSH